jgi:hypothetical protein
MRAAIVALQILISLVLTATLMPLLLVSVPAAQDDRVGLAFVMAIFTGSFAVIALIWPKRKPRHGPSSHKS